MQELLILLDITANNYSPVPAGETCAPLEPISNGGVIYSDLLLSPGVIAHYVCQDGYILHGHDERECAPDGGWINSEKGTPVCRGTYASDTMHIILSQST